MHLSEPLLYHKVTCFESKGDYSDCFDDKILSDITLTKIKEYNFFEDKILSTFLTSLTFDSLCFGQCLSVEQAYGEVTASCRQ